MRPRVLATVQRQWRSARRALMIVPMQSARSLVGGALPEVASTPPLMGMAVLAATAAALTAGVSLGSTACSEEARPTADDFLYPPIEPFNSGRLQVSDVHSLYFEECGNPLGKPVIMVHGGPGSGCSTGMRRYHDPSKYRIILLDQRGAGRSTPHASLHDNTCVALSVGGEKQAAG
jgi:hypothetical protein